MVEKLLRIEEASKILRLSVPTLRMWLTKKKIPCVRLGSRVLFTEQQLQEIIDAGKHPPRGTLPSQFVLSLSPITDFWREECVFHEDYEEAAGKLYDRHKAWLKENNQRVLSRNRFSNELLKIPGVGKRKDSRTRRVIYTGVKLRA